MPNLNPTNTNKSNDDAVSVRYDSNLADFLYHCDEIVERLIQLEWALKGLKNHIPEFVNANEAKSMLALNTMAVSILWTGFDAEVSKFRQSSVLGGVHV